MNRLLILSVLLASVGAGSYNSPIVQTGSKRLQLIREGKFDELEVRKLSRASRLTSGQQPLTDLWDFYYLINVAVGTPSQVIPVEFDTLNAELWVIDGSEYRDTNKTVFNETQSSTFTVKDRSRYQENNPFYGRFSYYIGNDKITLGDLQVKMHYCLTDYEIVFIYLDRDARLLQIIVQLNHNEKTFSVKGKKEIPYSRIHVDEYALRVSCTHQYAVTVSFENEAYAEHERLEASVEKALVIDGFLCFPIYFYKASKTITGVWLRIDLNRLVNLMEDEAVNQNDLIALQRNAYYVISTSAKGSEIENGWPLYETEFHIDGNTCLQWRKNCFGPTPETDLPKGLLLVRDGKVSTSTFNAAKNNKSFFTTHPFGLQLRWSNLTNNSVELETTNLWNPRKVQSLANLAKKKLLLDNNHSLALFKTVWK